MILSCYMRPFRFFEMWASAEGIDFIYCCGIDSHTKEEIASSRLNFYSLPFRYLGIRSRQLKWLGLENGGQDKNLELQTGECSC